MKMLCGLAFVANVAPLLIYLIDYAALQFGHGEAASWLDTIVAILNTCFAGVFLGLLMERRP